MSSPLVSIQVYDNVGTLTLNRPDKRNALSRALLAELNQALFDLHQEKRVRTVILTGAGTVFCAGMDLSEMKMAAESDNPHQQWGEDAEIFHETLTTMLRFPKPIIAAVNGPTVAGGAGLMLASDIVLATHNATFGLPEPRRGIVAGMVSPLLAFRIGAGRSARLLLESATIDAAEAYRIGLYHDLIEPDKLWAQATEVANQCAQGAPEALQLTKRMLNETIGEHLFTLLSAGAATSATARTTEAAAEGVAAFLEKRPPVWK